VHAEAEIRVDRRGDEERRDQEQHRGRNRRGECEREHELEAEVSAQDASAPLEHQLDEVPRNQEEEQHDQDDVERVQEQEERAVGDRNDLGPAGEPIRNQHEPADRDEDRQTDPELPPAPAALGGG
jgi:hypothetical protein